MAMNRLNLIKRTSRKTRAKRRILNNRTNLSKRKFLSNLVAELAC